MADKQIEFYKHEEYESLAPEWVKYTDLFLGKHSVLIDPKYLWLHEFESIKAGEGQKLRKIREERTQYINWIKPIVRRYVSLIFRNDPDLSPLTESGVFTDEEIENIDGKKTHFVKFIKNKIAAPYFLYGRSFVAVDSFNFQANTLAEEQALNLRPYWEQLTPFDVKDWEIETSAGENAGKLKWLRLEYDITEPRRVPTEPIVRSRYSKVFIVDGQRLIVQLYKAQGDPDKQKQHGKGDDQRWVLVQESTPGNGKLNEVPISYSMNSDESWIDDLIPVALSRHNHQSALENILLFQGMQRIIVTTEGDENIDNAVLNEANLLLVKSGTNVLVTEPCEPNALERRVDALTMQLFQLAFARNRMMPSDSKAVQGADTLREEADDFIAALQAAGSDIEAIINEAIRLHATFKGKPDADAAISLDLDITPEDVMQQVEILAALMPEVKRHPTWYKAAMKKIAVQMNLPDIEEITQEIEDAADIVDDRPQRERAAERITEGVRGLVTDGEEA